MSLKSVRLKSVRQKGVCRKNVAAPILGKDEKARRDKHSSIFCLFISDYEKVLQH